MISFIAGSAQFLAGTSTTIATPTTLNVVTGDTLVAAVRVGNSNNRVTGITDTAGNVFRLAGYVQILASSISFEVWYCTNCIGNASNTITASYRITNANRCINVTQWRTLATISPLDVVVATDASTANITSPSFTTAVANSVAIAVGMINSLTSTWTVGAGYTEGIRDADDVSITQYQIFSSIQTGVTASISNDTAVDKGIIVISLHEELQSGGGDSSSVVLRKQRTLPYKTGYYG